MGDDKKGYDVIKLKQNYKEIQEKLTAYSHSDEDGASLDMLG